MIYHEKQREILRNKEVVNTTSHKHAVEDWLIEFLDFNLNIELIKLETLDDIKIITRDYANEISGDEEILCYCKQFLFRGNLMYEYFYMVENMGDWSDCDETIGIDYNKSLENELARYVLNMYMDSRY
jgi:hypothetical protein